MWENKVIDYNGQVLPLCPWRAVHFSSAVLLTLKINVRRVKWLCTPTPLLNGSHRRPVGKGRYSYQTPASLVGMTALFMDGSRTLLDSEAPSWLAFGDWAISEILHQHYDCCSGIVLVNTASERFLFAGNSHSIILYYRLAYLFAALILIVSVPGVTLSILKRGHNFWKTKKNKNNLPLTVRSCQSLNSFKRKLRAHLE